MESKLSAIINFLNHNFWAIIGAFWGVITTTKISFKTAVISFFTGLITSILLTDLIVAHFSWGNQYRGALGFLFGLIGMNLTTATIRISREFSHSPLSTVSDVFKVIKGNFKEKDNKEEKEETKSEDSLK